MRDLTVHHLLACAAAAAAVLFAVPRDGEAGGYTLVPGTEAWVEATTRQYEAAAGIIGARGTVLGGKADAFEIVVPRPDLVVEHKGSRVPPEAGIEHRIRFWRCPCGSMMVAGDLVADEARAEVVAGALVNGNVGVLHRGPLFGQARPRLIRVRFQGEGFAEPLASAVRAAMDEAAVPAAAVPPPPATTAPAKLDR